MCCQAVAKKYFKKNGQKKGKKDKKDKKDFQDLKDGRCGILPRLVSGDLEKNTLLNFRLRTCLSCLNCPAENVVPKVVMVVMIPKKAGAGTGAGKGGSTRGVRKTPSAPARK